MPKSDRITAAFYLMLMLIAVGGFFLRLIDYDRLPGWRESDDEIHYAWTGLTWLKSGTPESWSYMETYSNVNMLQVWGTNWRLVSPMLEKPPLYSLLSGLTVILAGETELNQVRLSTIRLLPVFLNLLTIILTGIVASQVFGKRIGLLAGLLYAITPTIVMANRLSVTENLLTPLVLLAITIFLYRPHSILYSIFTGLIAGMVGLTKQPGIIAVFIFSSLYLWQQRRKQALVCLLAGLGVFSIYLLTAWYFDWPLFMHVMKAQQVMGIAGGLPQLVITILGRPLITTEHLFYDGTILFGLILLLSSPWWLLTQYTSEESWLRQLSLPPSEVLNHLKGGRMPACRQGRDSFQVVGSANTRQLSIYTFLTFPLVYMVYLGLTITGAEPIGSGQGFWGWYAYPLFPYVVTLVAVILYHLWRTPTFFLSLITVLILGSSTIRFFFMQLPHKYHYLWQNTLIGLFLLSSFSIIPHDKLKKAVMLILFAIYIGINIYTSLFLYKIYPSLPQPLP